MRIKYTNEEINNIINKFKECNSYKNVAESFNMSISSCKSLLNRNGYFMGNRKLKLDKIKADVLIIECKKLLKEKKILI